jgi:type VI protein secretion system component VasK
VAEEDEARPFRDLAQDDRRPVPDPTVLTTQALYREVSALQELIEQSIRGTREVIDQQFYKVEQQFELVERQRVEQKKDTKDAVDAALTAQKEAVREQTSASERSIAKSETATTKQIDQLAATFTNSFASFQVRLDELKERIVEVDRKAESPAQRAIGAKEDRSGLYAGVGVMVTILFFGVSVISLVIAFHK